MSARLAARAPQDADDAAIRFDWRAELVIGALALAEAAVLWLVVSLVLTSPWIRPTTRCRR